MAGHVRYKKFGERDWNGSISRSRLTDDEIKVMRFQGYIFEEDFSYIPPLEIPNPPKSIKVKSLKKCELVEKATYYICPNKKCGLFWDKRFKGCPCEHHCPSGEKLEKMMVCSSCKEPIYLPEDHNITRRVSHTCKDGKSPFLLRDYSISVILYERPHD